MILHNIPRHIWSVFICACVRSAGAASFLHSLPHYHQLQVAWMLSMNSSSLLSHPLCRVLLVFACVCECVLQNMCVNVPFYVFLKLWNSVNCSGQSLDLAKCVLTLFCNALRLLFFRLFHKCRFPLSIYFPGDFWPASSDSDGCCCQTITSAVCGDDQSSVTRCGRLVILLLQI